MVTLIGELISAHHEGNDEKFNSLVEQIVESYIECGDYGKADYLRRKTRYKTKETITNCEYRSNNGNCKKIGDFCLAIKEKQCPKLNAYIGEKKCM